MSEYLIEQIRATRNVDILHNAVVTGARAVDARLTEIEITDGISGTRAVDPCHGLFVLIGASPHTDWLEGVVARDDAGFVRVGTDATGDADDADEGHLPASARDEPARASSPSVTPAAGRSSGSRPRWVTEPPSSPPSTTTQRDRMHR